MKTCWILVLLCFSIPALAISGDMQKAVVHAMRKVPCVGGQGSGRHDGILSELAGTDTDSSECIEYQLRTEKVYYVIRPRVAVLLLLGADVSIKLIKNELLLHSEDLPKDIRCTVVTMSLRTEEEKKEQRRMPVCLSESGDEVPCSDESEPFR